MISPRAWSRLQLVPPAAVLLYAVVEITQRRSLAGDGPWTLIQGLTNEGYWLVDPYRLVGGSLGQTPFAILTMLGVSNMGILTVAHGVGYLLIPALAWAAALLLVRGTSTYGFLLLGYCLTTLTSGFVAVGDYNELFAFTALCLAAVIRFSRTPAPWLPWLAWAASIVVAVSHGLALLLAPLLIVAMDLLWRAAGSPSGRRLPWALTVGTLLLGTVISVMAIVWPYSLGNVGMAADLATPVTQNHALQFLLVWLAILPFAVIPRTRAVRTTAQVLLVGGAAAFALVPAIWSTPLQQHFSRTWSALLLAVVLAFAVLVRIREMRGAQDSARTWGTIVTGLSAVLFVALLVPALVDTVRFGAFVRDFQAVVTTRTGVIDNAEFVAMVPSADRYGWPWAYPSMSVLLGIGSDHALVDNPQETMWKPPFTVDNPPAIPDRFTR